MYPESEAVLAELIGKPEELEPLEAAVEQLLNAGKDEVVVLDLMSGPERMQALVDRIHKKGINTKGKLKAIAIGLGHDSRTPTEIDKNQELGVHYLIGDIKKGETWLKLDEKLGENKEINILISDTNSSIITVLPTHAYEPISISAEITKRFSNEGTAIINFGVNKAHINRMLEIFNSQMTGNVQEQEYSSENNNIILVLKKSKSE